METIYILETPDGDVWEFDTEDAARRAQYIFGGDVIEKIE